MKKDNSLHENHEIFLRLYLFLNKLLFYLHSNKNIEITKNDLLNSIWGVSESLNTHTLETHIYRLKQKINKLDPKLSFLLSNQKGLYVMQLKAEESL